MRERIRVMIAGCHPVVRHGLSMIIGVQGDMKMVAEVASDEECVQRVRELRPDVVIVDPEMPNRDWLAIIREISVEQPGTRFLVLAGARDEVQIYSAIKAGASGFLLMEAPTHQIVNAIRSVHFGITVLDPSVTEQILGNGKSSNGQFPKVQELTARELDVLRLITKGLLNKEIARELDLTEQTVMTHVRNILRKLALANRTQAALYARDHGLS